MKHGARFNFSRSVLFGMVVSFTFTALQGAEVCWRHLSSTSGGFPALASAVAVTGIVPGDFDGDKTNDLVLSFTGAAPALVLYHGTTWVHWPIELDALPLSAGGAAFDIDQDGDLDLVFGSEGPDVWWWENPFPRRDPSKSWVRHVIKDAGASFHRGELFADINASGRAQLLFWNQGSNAVYSAAIPSDPRSQTRWNFQQIFVVPGPPPARMQTLAAPDMDMDANSDLLAGNFWLKRIADNQFKATEIGTRPGRSAPGRFWEGTFPQVVVAPQNEPGTVMWYECKIRPDEAISWAGRQLLSSQVGPIATLAVGNIDGKGGDDILLAEAAQPGASSPPRAWILYSDGHGNFRTVPFPAETELNEGQLLDLDKDGDLDILSTSRTNPPRLDIWLNEKCPGQK